MAYSEASNKASQRYKAAKIKRIPLDVQIEEYERIKLAAEESKQGVNTYIKEAIRMRMEADAQNEESPV